MPGVRKEGEEGQAHGGTQKLTRERALCAVSEPEASPYCVSPRVAFVSALVAPIVFCPHTRPFCFAASSLSRISLELRPRKREASLSTDKGNRCVPSSRATSPSDRSLARSLPSLRFALSSRATKFSSSAAGIFISFIRLVAAFSLHTIFLKIFVKHTSLLVCNFFSSDVRRITGATREGRRGFISS